MPIILEQCELFGRPKGVLHFFSTVEGGCSVGNYASLNLGAYCGDLPENTMANRKLLCREIGIETNRLVIPREVHKDGICLIDNRFFQLNEEEQSAFLSQIDALVSRMTGVCLGITTADCVPVLLYAPQAQTIAAIHAGWRGIACEIIAKTIRKMSEMGAETNEIIACTGPCISAEAYQVGAELIHAFAPIFTREEMARICFQTADGTHADLRLAANLQLENAGIPADKIAIHPGCTFNDHRYFSARRQGVESGRMVSGIMMLG